MNTLASLEIRRSGIMNEIHALDQQLQQIPVDAVEQKLRIKGDIVILREILIAVQKEIINERIRLLMLLN